MNRTTLTTIIGCLLALALGVSAAFVVPHSAGPAAPSAKVDDAPVPDTDDAIEGPLATAYRTATGAKRTLLLVSAAEHATAAEMSTLIRIARGDDAAVRMLAVRWAELDPSGMFNSLYADFLLPDKSPGALPSRWVLSEVLFEEWPKKDLAAVIKALNDVPNFSGRDNMRMSLVNRSMKEDPETGLRLMGEWGIRNYMPDMKGLAAWTARDPQHAAEAVLKSASGYAGQEALKQVGKTWGQSDPAGALRFAGTLDAQARAKFAPEVMRTWAGKDLKAAAAFVSAQTDMSFRNSLAPGLVETWGKSEPSAALAWSQENLKGNARTEAIAGVIKAAAEKNLTTASQLVSDMEPGATQNRACASIFETWFAKGAKDPKEREAAFDWLASLPDAAARTAALEKVQWDWMWREPEAVRDFIAGPHGMLASQNMINQVARNQVAKNPEAAMEWAGQLGPERTLEARNSVLESWLQIRPEAASEYARKLPAGPERESAIRTVTQTLIWQAPDQTATWFHSLPTSDQTLVRQILDQNGIPADKRRQIDEALKKS
jgi:hypothetical protein